MSQIDSQKQAMYAQVNSIESDISFSLNTISGARNNVAHVDGAAVSLKSRLGKVRERGCAALRYMEKAVDMLAQRWTEISPSVKQTLAYNIEPLAAQANGLQAEVRAMRMQIDNGNIAYGQASATRLSAAASALRSRVSSEVSKVNTPLSELNSLIGNVEKDLKVVEQTVDLFSQANYPLRPGESPVLAVTGKILKGDKAEGTLYFTNQRFIFEAKKEVVLEKKFFIVTKKKTERTVLIDQPIGAIKEISKGRVGFIAWTGIYVRFKPDSREEESQFDVEGWEADLVKRFFDYIINGEADKDIAALSGALGTPAAPSIQVVYCPHCSAPYTREIFKGQKTVQCEYCGTQIVVQ